MTTRPSSKLISATAALSAGLLVLAGCQSESGTINGEVDEANGDDESSQEEEIPGLPSAEIVEWEGACETLNIDEAHNFFETDDWKSESPRDHSVGEGNLSHGLSCSGLVNWPVFTYPSDREYTPDGQLEVILIPLDPELHDVEGNHATDEWLEHTEEEHQRYDNFVNQSMEGPWDRGHLVASDTDLGDLYNFQFADVDFALEGHFSVPHDPAEGNPESFEIHDEDPEDWIHFDFDRESAEQFLVEEYLPGVYDNIMDGLER